MCMHYKYFLQIKPDYDIKYLKTGIQSQFVYLCEVEDVKTGKFKLNYDKERFNLIVKECGQCLICRFKRASIKACQAQSEFKTTGKGTFVTLTFGHEQMTDYIMHDERYADWSYYKKKKYINYLQWTLEKREFQLFMKRLRKEYYYLELRRFCELHGLYHLLDNKYIKLPKCYDFKPTKIRFLHSAEYGTLKERPHHHICLFGVNFTADDSFVRYSWKLNKNVLLHHNHFLSSLWKFGEVTVDSVNYQTCNYVARYITKKTVNDNKVKKNIDVSSTVYKGRLPEYCTQSNRPGLGYQYFIDNAEKIISDEHLYFRNMSGEYKEVPLPRYYKELMRRYFPVEYRNYRAKSLEKQLEFSERTPDELFTRMNSDRNKIFKHHKYFVGSYEKSCKSVQLLNYEQFNMKKLVFNDKSISDIYKSSYSDTDFIQKENIRITAYKNFEKHRRYLLRCEFNNYVSNRYNFPYDFHFKSYFDKYNEIKQISNPFKLEACNKNIFNGKLDYWLNYDKEYLRC